MNVIHRKNKNKKKIFCVVLGMIVTLSVFFFLIDYNRVRKQENPIFCISNEEMYQDGGTKVYFGLGYKVIDFNTLLGFDDIKIGTWFMDYDDFDEERKAEEIKYVEKLRKEQY